MWVGQTRSQSLRLQLSLLTDQLNGRKGSVSDRQKRGGSQTGGMGVGRVLAAFGC